MVKVSQVSPSRQSVSLPMTGEALSAPPPMAVPVQVTAAVVVGRSVADVGLAASAVHVCVRTKTVVKKKTAQTAATKAFKALFDLGVLDFLITNLSLWRRVGLSGRVAPDNLASFPDSSMTDDEV
jgi:hypothetical protein